MADDSRDDLGLGMLAANERPLPIALRNRLEVALLTDGAEPRALPLALRARLEGVLVAKPARPWLRTISSVAAAVVLIAGSVTLAVRTGHRSDGVHVARSGLPPSTVTTDLATSSELAGAAAPALTPQVTAGAKSASSAFRAGTTSPYPAPPFTSTDAAAPAALSASAPAPGSQPPPPPAAPKSGPPLKIAVVRGDDAQVAGFEAYVNRLNAAGGAGGHRFTLATASPSAPVRDAVATVNLSGVEVATGSGARPAWVSGPLLETDAAVEASLTGDVYDLASSLERQAHLIADALVPTRAPGLRAVIYKAAGGPYASTVPAALTAVLRARGVEPTMVTAGASSVFLPADVAFVSLDRADAERWFRQAHQMNYAPARGIAGIGDLYDAALLANTPEGTQAIAPYGPGAPAAETSALQGDTQRPLGTALIHGWVTGKALAYAVWLASANDAAGVRAGLDRLPSSFAPGFAPAYGVRPGTHSRKPEGILLTVRSGAFAADGDFRTDRF